MRGRLQTSDRWLLLAFLSVVVLFALATVGSQRISRAIETSSRILVEDTGPSIRSLSSARSALASEQLRLDDYLDAVASGQRPSRAVVEDRWREVGAALAAYQALPAFFDERAPSSHAPPDLRQVSRLRDEVLHLADAGQGGRAVQVEKTQLDAAMDAAGAELDRLIALNASMASQLGDRIRRLHARAHRVALLLDALVALLAFVVAWLALRKARASRQRLEQKYGELEERGAELEQFSGRMAHDVLSPLLTAGIGWELARKLHPEDERLGRIAEASRAAIQRSKRLVEDLLAFSLSGAKPPPGAATEVAPVLADVLANLEQEAADAGTQVISHPMPPIRVACSDGVLTSILLNLIRNAIKHMDASPQRRIEIHTGTAFGVFRCEVRDTGPGIPFEQQRLIFEPYVRGKTRAAGIGLGLATVKRLVAAHGGFVGVRSAEGEGATFWFELPLAPAAQPQLPTVH